MPTVRPDASMLATTIVRSPFGSPRLIGLLSAYSFPESCAQRPKVTITNQRVVDLFGFDK
jgi:hypothetical protein